MRRSHSSRRPSPSEIQELRALDVEARLHEQNRLRAPLADRLWNEYLSLDVLRNASMAVSREVDLIGLVASERVSSGVDFETEAFETLAQRLAELSELSSLTRGLADRACL